MLPWPGRHIPIDTSLCTQSPQVRIYGFVAAGMISSGTNQIKKKPNQIKLKAKWRNGNDILFSIVKSLMSVKAATEENGKIGERETGMLMKVKQGI